MSININPIETYVPTIYVNNSEPDLDETNLNHAEQALKRVTDAANAAILALESLDSAKIDAAKIVNNLLATDTSTVLSGPMGKALGDRLTAAENLLTRLNSEMSYFKAYKFTDSDVLDNDIKTAIGWYINNAIDKKRHSFIITLELTKGSTFSIFGMTASTPSYCAAQVFSYALPVPLYGIRNNGTWTWK